MTRSREPAGERSVAAASASDPGFRGGGRPRDAALDEAIILATRERLMKDGYSRMTIGDIVADANVTRPTLYRRWKNKLDLVADALDYGFRKQGDMYTVDLSQFQGRETLVEAVRRVNPTYYNPGAMVLMGNFAGEAVRTPELLDILRRHAVEPRVALVERALDQLRESGAVRAGIDAAAIATLCFGAYFAAFYRGEDTGNLAERVVAVLWPAIAAEA
jgi:AcrR family transcriptional regulator